MAASRSDCQNLVTCANLPPAFLIASPHTPITHAALSELKRVPPWTTHAYYISAEQAQPRLQQWRVHPPSLDCAPPKNGTCEILRASPQQRQLWQRWNPFDVRCEETPDAAYRPVHRATGLAYQAYHFPCTSVCRSCRVVHDVRSMALES